MMFHLFGSKMLLQKSTDDANKWCGKVVKTHFNQETPSSRINENGIRVETYRAKKSWSGHSPELSIPL